MKIPFTALALCISISLFAQKDSTKQKGLPFDSIRSNVFYIDSSQNSIFSQVFYIDGVKYYKDTRWGFDFNFSSGGVIFTDDLNEKFSAGVPLGLEFGFWYKRYGLIIGDYGSLNSETKEDIDFNGIVWRKYDKIDFSMPAAAFAYAVIANLHTKLAPFIGIASTELVSEYGETANIGLHPTTTFQGGLILEKHPRLKAFDRLILLRFKYTYSMPQFSSKYPGFNGNIHTITIGIGIFRRADTFKHSL